MQQFSIKTHSRVELFDITSEVAAIVRESGKSEGICTIYCPHTTAAITINENADPDVTADLLKKLNQLVPQQDSYRHMEGNSDAHIKSSLIGSSVQVIVASGELQLGTWQGIYFCEFDGPRHRNVWITVN
jgi:secondary thiamine-phosphate synthase enzyme